VITVLITTHAAIDGIVFIVSVCVCVSVLFVSEITREPKVLWAKDMVKSAEEFENCFTPMHCGVSDVLVPVQFQSCVSITNTIYFAPNVSI